VKQKTAEAVFGVEGGAGSSLQATQKRTLHVRGICTVREDGLKEVLVQLFKPLGSTFRFIGDDTEQERAPASLAYLAAGIGFCFMTQIGRYAHIVKQDLKGYSIVQDTIYKVGADSAEAHPVDTHTFLQTSEDDEAAQRTLYMSERTCFLHAAMRGSNKTQISVVLNGAQL
jgi:organic hydroperoxide reductase OsmC/OhrA